MSDKNIKLKQDGWEDPFRIKLKGARWWLVSFGVLWIAMAVDGIYGKLDEANELRREELRIKREQTQLIKQYLIQDSIIKEQNQKKR